MLGPSVQMKIVRTHGSGEDSGGEEEEDMEDDETNFVRRLLLSGVNVAPC